MAGIRSVSRQKGIMEGQPASDRRQWEMRWTSAQGLHSTSSCSAEAREQKRVPSLTCSRVPRSTWMQTSLCKLEGFPGGTVVKKKSTCNAGDTGSVPGLGRFPGVENSNLLQHPCLGNPMDRGTWWATVRSVARVRHSWATEYVRLQDETGRRKGGRGWTAATSAFSASKQGCTGFSISSAAAPWCCVDVKRQNVGHWFLCLCRPLSHGVLLGSSFMAAHGLTPAKVVFRWPFPIPPLFGCVRGGSSLGGLLVWRHLLFWCYWACYSSLSGDIVSIRFLVLNFLLLVNA